jgi:hypothetical protein
MVLMPINPKKVKVGRRYYCVDKSKCDYCEIIAIHKNGYKIRQIGEDDEPGRILPKLRKTKDIMVCRPDSMVGLENPKEK